MARTTRAKDERPMLYSAIATTLTRLELAANILAYEDLAARGNTFATDAVSLWSTMLAASGGAS